MIKRTLGMYSGGRQVRARSLRAASKGPGPPGRRLLVDYTVGDQPVQRWKYGGKNGGDRDHSWRYMIFVLHLAYAAHCGGWEISLPDRSKCNELFLGLCAFEAPRRKRSGDENDYFVLNRNCTRFRRTLWVPPRAQSVRRNTQLP